MQPGVKLYVDISRLGTVPDDLKDIKKKVEGYHREYEERIHQLCASRYGPQLDTARMREIQDDLDRIERGVDTLQKTLDEIVKCYAACEKRTRERGAIGNLDKGIPQSERVLKNAVDVYGKILDQGELFAQGFWDEIVSQGNEITEGFGTIFAKLFYCIPESDNLSKLFGLDSAAIQKWINGNTETYKAGLNMLIEHPILVFKGMLEEWKKTYEEKGPAYIAGKLGCDSFIAILESAAAVKTADGAGNVAKKIDQVVDTGKTRSSVKRKEEDAVDLAKQAEKATKISKKVKDLDAPGFSSMMQRNVDLRRNLAEYAEHKKIVTSESGSNVKATFASEEKLLSHFNKHGGEFKGAFNSADEYLQGAQDVMQNGYKVEYAYKGETRIGYFQFMGNNSKGNAKFAFVGTNNEGHITTFHTESGKTFWKMLNGVNIPVINPK